MVYWVKLCSEGNAKSSEASGGIGVWDMVTAVLLAGMELENNPTV